MLFLIVVLVAGFPVTIHYHNLREIPADHYRYLFDSLNRGEPILDLIDLVLQGDGVITLGEYDDIFDKAEKIKADMNHALAKQELINAAKYNK
jgi:hypothetical protein